MTSNTQKPRIPVLVTSIDGSACSDDGMLVRVGVTLAEGEQLDVMLSPDRVVDFITLVGPALREAKRKQPGDIREDYVFPTDTWEIRPQPGGDLFTFAYRLLGGAELCFQLDRANVQHFAESLAVILGINPTPSIPAGTRH